MLGGLVAWYCKPANRFGPLMIAAGLGTLLSSFSSANANLLSTIGMAFDLLPVRPLHACLPRVPDRRSARPGRAPARRHRVRGGAARRRRPDARWLRPGQRDRGDRRSETCRRPPACPARRDRRSAAGRVRGHVEPPRRRRPAAPGPGQGAGGRVLPGARDGRGAVARPGLRHLAGCVPGHPTHDVRDRRSGAVRLPAGDAGRPPGSLGRRRPAARAARRADRPPS